MTNFKNLFASDKHRFHKTSVSGASYSGKKLLAARAVISRILLLITFFNFALASLAEGPGGGIAAIMNSGSGAAGPTRAPAGPTPPPPSNPGGIAAIMNAGSNNATAPANNAGGIAAIMNAGSSNTIIPTSNSGGIAAIMNAGSSAVQTNIVTQLAERNAADFSWLSGLMDWITNKFTDPVGQGIQNFWMNTAKDWFTNLGSLLQFYIKQIVMFVVEPIVRALTAVMVQFAYNPDVSVGKDNFSKQVQWLATLVQNVSNDLLLLFFILSIWRYWANAAWKGGSMMGAVARILVAASATTAWPTIYHYVILISNSLTKYLIDNNALDAMAISNAVATAISELITSQPTFTFIGTLLGSGQLNFVTVAAVPFVLVAQVLLVAAIGLAIIGSIIVFFTMKVIQIIIIIAAFVFGPFFLCLLVSPDTDSVVSGFIRSFIETSLWTFVWTIYLMLFVFALGVHGSADVNGQINSTITQSTQNPWFILFFELGVLQAMIQTPGYLSRGKISEAGEFLEIFGLWKMGKGVGNYLFGADGKVSKAYRHAKRNNPLTKNSGGPSMALGGEDFLPAGDLGIGQHNAPLSSLNDYNKRGMATVLGKGGRLNLASAAAGSSMALGGGSAADSNPLIGMGTDGSGVNPIAYASRSALGQLNSALGGGSRGGVGIDGGNPSLVQKTSLGLPADSDPWHDTRGRRMNPVDYLAAYNLKQIRSGNVAFTKNARNPNQNSIDFDDAGVIRKLNHREHATPQEEAMLGAVGALATMPYSDGKGHNDARAVTATNNAVKDANKWDAPLGRRISWALSGGRVPKYVQNIENDRLEKEKVKARIEGASAYIKGESGNAYTKFLEWKFDGKMDDNMRSMLAYTGTNTGATLGGFNLNWESGIQRLGKMGMDVNPVTMGIASHEGITGMKVNEQAQAIPAGLQLVNSYLGEMGVDPSNKDVWNASSLHWAAADGVLQGLSPQHFRAARAIAEMQGITAVNPYNVNKVMEVHKQFGSGESTQAYEKTALEYFDPTRAQNSRSFGGRGGKNSDALGPNPNSRPQGFRA